MFYLRKFLTFCTATGYASTVNPSMAFKITQCCIMAGAVARQAWCFIVCHFFTRLAILLSLFAGTRHLLLKRSGPYPLVQVPMFSFRFSSSFFLPFLSMAGFTFLSPVFLSSVTRSSSLVSLMILHCFAIRKNLLLADQEHSRADIVDLFSGVVKTPALILQYLFYLF